MIKPTTRSRIRLKKPIVVELAKKLPAFYETQRFIAVSTRALH
jgi:hypothetical protein